MVRVTFIAPSGTATTLDGDVGQSVMDIGKRAGIENMIGECGGSAACATCHVHVAAGWIGRVGPPSDNEADLLDFARGRRADSRLACQIRLVPALEGLVVHMPERQGI
jgi:2Fe-2S ferredoxin